MPQKENKKEKKISIVVPCHNEYGNLTILAQKIAKVWAKITDYKYDITFVNDGSTDKTWEEIVNLSRKSNIYKGINMSRNFGHQAALEAGLKSISENIEAVIMMDADLQHPPEVIPKLIKKWERGFEIVNTKRHDDEKINFSKRVTSRLFYFFMNLVSDIEIDPGASDFRLINKNVLKEIKKINEKDKFFRGLFNWIGFNTTKIEFVVGKRINGQSSYNIKKLFNFARIGLTSFSSLPMKLILTLGVFLFSVSIISVIGMVITRYFIDREIFTGTAILAAFILANNGILMIFMGIMATYQLSMYKELQNRPVYIIKEQINIT